MPRRRTSPKIRQLGGINYRYRLQKSEGFLRAADACYQVSEWESSISRAYYAAYHLVAAVIEAKIGFTRKPCEHDTLLNDFRENVGPSSKRPLFYKEDVERFDTLLSLRYAADYDDAFNNDVVALRALQRAKVLNQKIREVLENG